MGSYDNGKPEVVAWVREHFPAGSTVLDVGACDGLWRRLLPEYAMDAVEVWGPNWERLTGYRDAYNLDIQSFRYDWYDLIIFGDVIEHLSVPDAQAVLEYARPRCRDMIVAVPWKYKQGECYGNPFERHIQDDLTAALFAERYPGFAVLVDPGLPDYMYYHKEEGGA